MMPEHSEEVKNSARWRWEVWTGVRCTGAWSSRELSDGLRAQGASRRCLAGSLFMEERRTRGDSWSSGGD